MTDTEARKAYKRAHAKAKYETPEGKAAKKAYAATPERKAYVKAYNKAKYATPEGKAAAKVYEATPERKAYRKAYHESPERKAVQKAYDKSPERMAVKKAYHESPEGKAVQKAYRESPEGKAVVIFHNAKRRASKIFRTPSWCEIEDIKEVYATCPVGFEVDHIIPLQGKLVSGLHVLSNLQHLTAKDNREKYRNYDINQYEYRKEDEND